MQFKYAPRDISGMHAFRNFVERSPEGGVSEQFERVFDRIQHRPLRERWHSVVRDLIPVTNPNNEAEAFLVCNAIRHIDSSREHPSGRDFMDWGREYVRNFDGHIPGHAFYRDFRHFAFAKVARSFPNTVLGEFCAMVTIPHPNLVGRTSLGLSSLFYSGLEY